MTLLNLDVILIAASDRMLPRLAASLAVCAQLSILPSHQRMWSLHKLRRIMTTSRLVVIPLIGEITPCS